MSVDGAALGRDQAATQADQRLSAAAAAGATIALNAAETTLASAERSPATAVGAQADSQRAQLARDEAALTRDTADNREAELIAPAAGTVTAVNGTLGALAGPAGVRVPTLGGSPAQTSPGFSLLPTTPPAGSSSGGDGSSFTNQPLIELSTGPGMLVVAQVPERDVSRITAGATARVRITALPAQLGAHLLRIGTDPRQVGGAVDFEAVFALDVTPPAALRPGMTADVAVARGRPGGPVSGKPVRRR